MGTLFYLTRLTYKATTLRMLLHYRPGVLPTSLQPCISQSYPVSLLLFRTPQRQQFSSATRVNFEGAGYGHRPRRFPRRLFFVAPLSGLAILFLSSSSNPPVNSFLSSPTLIPCPPNPPHPASPTFFIQSPYERSSSIWSRFMSLLRSRILEPLLTARRFLYLCFLFVPVLVSAPMLLIGAPGSGEPKRKRAAVKSDRRLKRRSKLGGHKGERWGAVWWYGFMVRQMQKAGPTFIKVFRFLKACLSP